MENKNLPAFPPNAGWQHSEAKGLTKREYFAGLAMQGFLANSELLAKGAKAFSSEKEIFCSYAEDAVKIADAILAELDKPLTDQK